MESKFSTLDLIAPVRPTGYRVAVAVLGLGLCAAVAVHVRTVGGLKRELAARTDKARLCETQRQSLSDEVRALSAKPPLATATAGACPAVETPPAATVPDTQVRDSSGASPPTEQAVKSLVGGGQAKMQACYRRALRRDPDLGTREMRIRLSFTLRSSGRVGGVGFSPSPARELRSCLREVVGRWKVKPFGGESIAVEVPITLAPQG